MDVLWKRQVCLEFDSTPFGKFGMFVFILCRPSDTGKLYWNLDALYKIKDVILYK